MDIEEFKVSLNKVDWRFLDNPNLHEENVSFFEKQVIALMDQHIPQKKVALGGRQPEWLQSGTVKKIRQRDILHKNCESGDMVDFVKYKRWRNEINQERRFDKNKYHADKVRGLKDSTSIWDLFNQLTNFRNKSNLMVSKLVTADGVVIDDKESIAEMFAGEYIISSSASDVSELYDQVSQYENDFVYEDEYDESLCKNVSKAEIAGQFSSVKK